MIKVVIIESERGWGSKIVEVKEFKTDKAADKFIASFNEENHKSYRETGIVPDWYMYARKEN